MTTHSLHAGSFMPARSLFLFLLAAWLVMVAWIAWRQLTTDTRRLPPPTIPPPAAANHIEWRSFQPTGVTSPFPSIKDNPFTSTHVQSWNERQAAERKAREVVQPQPAPPNIPPPASPPPPAAEAAAPPAPPPPPPPVHEFRFAGVIQLTDGQRVAALESSFGHGIYRAGDFCGPLLVAHFDEQHLRLRLRNDWEAVVPLGRPALISAEEWPSTGDEKEDATP